MRGQVKIQQKKLSARKRRRFLYLSFYTLALLVLILCALSYISGLDALSLKEIVVTGNERLSTSTIEAIVSTDIGGTYWGLFPRRSILLYPGREIRDDIASLPAIKSVDVSRSAARTLQVRVVERSGAAEWCVGASPSDCYISDESGFIFAHADKGLSAALIYRSATTSDPLGRNIVPPDVFKKIHFFMGELAGLSVDPREASIGDQSYMTVTLGGGGRLIINTADDLSAVLGNIAAVISNRTVAPSLADFLTRLDYMKLDIGNKVVYKLKK